MITKEVCFNLADQYHKNNTLIASYAENLSPENFLRLFVTYHGMGPVGKWQTHTYVKQMDSITKQYHFFLIPITRSKLNSPIIKIKENILFIDKIKTEIVTQNIPYTTPFWYFHYNPNREDNPFYSLTMNLSPSCSEKCTLCAGAKTGRVNNGLDETLPASYFINSIFHQFPEAKKQIENLAIVTGCFDDFNELYEHLKSIKESIINVSPPKTFCVLEHNIRTEEEFDLIAGQLGYQIYITLECFDQKMRDLALNGKVGKKGRDSNEFLKMAQIYAQYLEKRPELNQDYVYLTYLVGIDSLEITEFFFKQLNEINKQLKRVKVLPWISLFTPYNESMKVIQNEEFSLEFLFEVLSLSEKYFEKKLIKTLSGGTHEGYARGFY